jgi:hypothetical protein
VAVGERQFARRVLAAVDGTALRHVVCMDGKPYGTITLAELEAEVTRGSRHADRRVRCGERGTLNHRDCRAERRVGARLFGRWRCLSAVPVMAYWMVACSVHLYIVTLG